MAQAIDPNVIAAGSAKLQGAFSANPGIMADVSAITYNSKDDSYILRLDNEGAGRLKKMLIDMETRHPVSGQRALNSFIARNIGIPLEEVDQKTPIFGLTSDNLALVISRADVEKFSPEVTSKTLNAITEYSSLIDKPMNTEIELFNASPEGQWLKAADRATLAGKPVPPEPKPDPAAQPQPLSAFVPDHIREAAQTAMNNYASGSAAAPQAAQRTTAIIGSRG